MLEVLSEMISFLWKEVGEGNAASNRNWLSELMLNNDLARFLQLGLYLENEIVRFDREESNYSLQILMMENMSIHEREVINQIKTNSLNSTFSSIQS